MLSFLPAPIIGIINALLLGINTVFWCLLLYVLLLVRLILPFKPVQVFISKVMIWVSESWVACNTGWMKLTQGTRWQVAGDEELKRESWYLVLSNHQSWVDILAMQRVFNRRAPFLKFFLKQQLIWVPVIGLAWWALDFPFMHRHTKAQLAKRPELKGKDIEATKAACEKFRYTPVTIFNFMEGTRFTPEKHQRQNSPYKNLLKPKAGGTAFVFGAMGEMIHTMLDVTIVYPDGTPGIWDYMCGRVTKIIVDIRTREVPAPFLGMDYEGDREKRVEFQRWVSGIWAEKDALIDQLKKEA